MYKNTAKVPDGPPAYDWPLSVAAQMEKAVCDVFYLVFYLNVLNDLSFVFQIIVLWVLLHIQRFLKLTKKCVGGDGGRAERK